MTKLIELKAVRLIKALKRLGFVETRSIGSHVRLVHPGGRKITVAVHPKPIPKGTLGAILRQAQVSQKEIINELK